MIGTEKELKCLNEKLGGDSTGYTLTILAEGSQFTKVSYGDTNTHFQVVL